MATMLLLSIIFDDRINPFEKVLEFILQVAYHIFGAALHSFLFFVLFALISVFPIHNFGTHVLGPTIGETLSVISRMPDCNLWSCFLAFSLYYKISICIGCFFSTMHFLFLWGD